MNYKELQQAAKEAGLLTRGNCYYAVCHQTEIERFAAIIEKRTIERCAVVCENIDSLASSNPPMLCAAAIRKLGDE